MNTATLPAVQIPSAWRAPAAAIFAYLVALLLVFSGTAIGMVEIWSRSENFTHAFVVLPITLWLVWRQRAALAALQPRTQPWMLLPLAVLAAIWWLADRVVVNAAEHFAFTGMLVAGVPGILGWAVARQILFPLAFLFFAVPFGEFLTPVLMQATADFTVGALRFTGIPVFREGQQFVIPSGRWSVVEACSGIRYLMASFMVGSLFAYLNYRSAWRRVAFASAALVVPVVANWLRAYMIVMLGHLSGNKIATGVDHILYGWLFFGVVITAMFFVGARWADSDAPGGVAAPGAAAVVPVASGAWPMIMAALCVMAIAWPVLLGSEELVVRPAPGPFLPARLAAGWTADDTALTTWRPRYEGASLEQHRGYRGPQGAAVGVHLMYYRDQAPGRKLVSSVNILVHSENPVWNLVRQELRATTGPVAAGAPAVWQEATVLGGDSAGGGALAKQTLKLRRAYWVGDRWTHSDFQAKLWEAWIKLRGLPDDAAAVILSAEDNPAGSADPMLDAFTSANFDQLERALMHARGR